MKKYIIGAALFLTALSPALVHAQTTTATASTYPAGCTSNTGYSSINGESCGTTMTTAVPTVTIISPNGGETFTVGSIAHITWTSSNADTLSIGYNISSASSGSGAFIAYNIPNTGSYNWTVNVGNTTNTQTKVYVSAYTAGVGSVGGPSSAIDYSDNYFTVITQPNTTPTTSTTVTSRTYLPGCTSTFGFSSVNGNACDGSTPTSTPTITFTASSNSVAAVGSTANLVWYATGTGYDSYQIMIGDTVTNTERQLYDKVSMIGLIPASQTSFSWNVPDILTDFSAGTSYSADQIKNSFYLKINLIKSDAAGGMIVASSNRMSFYPRSLYAGTVASDTTTTTPTVATYPSGCTSTAGFSSTTGKACSGTTQVQSTSPSTGTSATQGDVDTSGQSSCVDLQNNMRYRMTDARTNSEVSELQDFLNPQYLSSTPTGYFGRGTVAAVKKYQASVGLSSTGYVGPLTRAKIKAETCAAGI